ncbi:MAG TPA: hypothetical protein VNL35_10075 [Chloroflexota bacterium]|nr:hypothetical protein [Chloroflexota bacterium]
MKTIKLFWQRRFLGIEFCVAILITGIFALGAWICQSRGISVADALLGQQRTTVYATLASICGSLLGFSITVTFIVVGFAESHRLEVVRNSQSYPILWRTLAASVRALGGATLVTIGALLLDRDNDPKAWVMVAVAGMMILAIFRVSRTIWVLERVIMLITGPSRGYPPADVGAIGVSGNPVH